MRVLATFHKIHLLLLLIRVSMCDDFNYELIKDYLQFKNVRIVLFATGEHETPIETIARVKYFQNDGIWIGQWNTFSESNFRQFNYERFFVRSSHQICVVINLASNQTPDILHEISQRKMFHFERSWLMFGSISNNRTFDLLSDENVNVDAEIATVLRVGENEYQIGDVYNPSHTRHRSLRIDNIGNWSKESGLEMIEEKTKIERRKDLGGVTFLSVIAIPRLPRNTTLMEHLNSNENTHLDSSSNSYRMYQFLSEMYNFKMFIHRSAIWGSLKSDGTWIGALGLTNRSEVDMCISGVRWEVDRYGAFEQTTEGYYVRVLFLFRHPRSVDTKKIFLAPFDAVVWSLILAIGFIISVESHAVNLVQKCMEWTKTNVFYSDSFFTVCGVLFQQAYSVQPLRTSSRVLATTMLIFSLIIYQFFSSFIVGALLTEPPKTIKTVQHLYNSPLHVVVDDIPYIQDVFKYVQEEWTAKLYQKVMTQPKPTVPLRVGLDMVKKDLFAITTDANYAYKILQSILTDREACDLQEVNFVPKIPTGSPVPNKSPLKEMIKIGIRKLYETGMLAYLWKTWIGHKPKCIQSVDVVAVDFMHFSSALYVLGVGMQISIGFLLGELLFFKRFARQTEI